MVRIFIPARLFYEGPCQQGTKGKRGPAATVIVVLGAPELDVLLLMGVS